MSTVFTATVAAAGTITDKVMIGIDESMMAVDETREGVVIATPFTLVLSPEQFEGGTDEWEAILARFGWTVTAAWADHDGYWTADAVPAAGAPV